MEWFVLWLKKIILLVLLAAFLDLILPNTSLQRYVKMVMGLLILLTIITPLFSLFHVTPEELAARFSRYQQQLEREGPNPAWQRLSQKMLETRDEQVERYVSTQMESLIGEQIEAAFGVGVASVDVRFRDSAAGGPKIETITLVVGGDEGGEQSAPTGETVRPIRPVEIAVEVESAARQAEQESVPAAGGRQTLLQQRIAAQVARDWQVAPEQVRVIPADEQERS
ncbi:stage III sporulation protein AF [Brevibacillus marinus]|uniref:stage III sporulation protein AF n=1 Tax=Brevibacillus marinus TaxID=2496837 RepID=UPI000F82BA71|nr:stage III sporulation protein AF [Brevibacillus marinus]